MNEPNMEAYVRVELSIDLPVSYTEVDGEPVYLRASVEDAIQEYVDSNDLDVGDIVKLLQSNIKDMLVDQYSKNRIG